MQNANKQVGIDELRAAIPPECWKTTNWQAWTLLMRDVLLAGIIMYLAYLYIPLINDPSLRFVAWAFYGWLEGLVFTGLWVNTPSPEAPVSLFRSPENIH